MPSHCIGVNAGSAAINELRRIVEQETAELSRSKYAVAELVSHSFSSARMALYVAHMASCPACVMAKFSACQHSRKWPDVAATAVEFPHFLVLATGHC